MLPPHNLSHGGGGAYDGNSKKIAPRTQFSIAAVVLKYNNSTGFVPDDRLKASQQVKQKAKASEWRLADEDLPKIDEVSLEGKTTSL